MMIMYFVIYVTTSLERIYYAGEEKIETIDFEMIMEVSHGMGRYFIPYID